MNYAIIEEKPEDLTIDELVDLLTELLLSYNETDEEFNQRDN